MNSLLDSLKPEQQHYLPADCPHYEMLTMMDVWRIKMGGEAKCPSCGILISLERIKIAQRWRPQCIGCGKFLKMKSTWNQCADCDTRTPEDY